MNFQTMTMQNLVDFLADALLEFEGNDLDEAVMWLLSKYPDFPYNKNSIKFDNVVLEAIS